jgi:hypothetical protein
LRARCARHRPSTPTLRAINDLVVGAAVKLGVEDGSKLRVDTTVVETDIHHPTDNTLLWDVVRVLTRLLGRLTEASRRLAATALGMLTVAAPPRTQTATLFSLKKPRSAP